MEPRQENSMVGKPIVQAIDSPQAKPGHWLVVYEESQLGRRFSKLVPPGEYFRRPLLSFGKQYSAYWISADPHLKLTSTRVCKTRDHIHTFTLTIQIYYQIKIPQVLIERLDQDPLLSVSEFANNVLAQQLLDLDWQTIKSASPDFFNISVPSSANGRDNPRSCFHQIRGFAFDYGLDIYQVTIDRTLSEDEIEVELSQKKAEAERGMLRAQTTLDFERQKHQQSLKMSGVIDDVVKSINDMLVRAGEKVDSYPEMKRAMQELAQIRDMSGYLVAPVQDHEGNFPARQGSPAVRLMTAGTPDVVGRLLADLAGHLGLIKSPQRFQLYSDCLHLVAESLLGEKAKPEMVAHYCSGIVDAIEDLDELFLDRDQIAFLRQLIDTQGLRRELRGER